MALELLTFNIGRLPRLKDEYASAVSSGKAVFQLDGYDFLVDYAENLIEYLEDYFEKAKKVKPVYCLSSNSI